MAKLYLPVLHKDKVEIISPTLMVTPSSVRALARLLYTMMPNAVIKALIFYLLPSLTHEQVNAVIQNRLQKLTNADDEKIHTLFERVFHK